MTQPPRGPDEWAGYLKENWEARSHSTYRDRFVSPNCFGDEQRWSEQGDREAAAVLTGLDPDWLRTQNLLDYGCGVGRLARHFVTVAASYTGVDIAPGMLEEARQRCVDLRALGGDAPRFFETDGLGIPDGARDREYGLILAVAVFIHCPKSVIGSLVTDAYSVLSPGGAFRLQVRGDPTDHEGIRSMPVAEQGLRNTTEIRETVPEEQAVLHDEHYMGYPFRYAELRAFLNELAPGTVDLYREELTCIYAVITKPA